MFILERIKLQSPDFAWPCTLFFYRPRLREIRVRISWAFPGWFNHVVNTLAPAILGLPLAVLVWLSWNDVSNCRSQLGLSCCLSEFWLYCACLFQPQSSSVRKCFWHIPCCLFGRLLPISLCYAVDYPFHSLWPCSSLQCKTLFLTSFCSQDAVFVSRCTAKATIRQVWVTRAPGTDLSDNDTFDLSICLNVRWRNMVG